MHCPGLRVHRRLLLVRNRSKWEVTRSIDTLLLPTACQEVRLCGTVCHDWLLKPAVHAMSTKPARHVTLEGPLLVTPTGWGLVSGTCPTCGDG